MFTAPCTEFEVNPQRSLVLALAQSGLLGVPETSYDSGNSD